MTTYNDTKAVHQTLSTTVADLVQLTQFWDGIEITNSSGTSALTVVFNTATAPTAKQAGSETVEAGVTKLFSPVAQKADGVPGSTSLPCHQLGIVGSGNGYSVVGVAGKEG